VTPHFLLQGLFSWIEQGLPPFSALFLDYFTLRLRFLVLELGIHFISCLSSSMKTKTATKTQNNNNNTTVMFREKLHRIPGATLSAQANKVCFLSSFLPFLSLSL
jgi:hypothetical protein